MKPIAILLAAISALSVQARAAEVAESDHQKWALAASAILAQRNGDRHDLLGGRVRTPNNVNYAHRLLAGSWGVRSRPELIETLRNLRETGMRAEFDAFARSPRGSALSLHDPDDHRRMEIANAFHPKFGSKSILAWDFMRYISLCRWGYLAGFFPEREAWDEIMPAAVRLQQTFSSWQEMGWNFIVGREFWSPDDDQSVNTNYAFRLLLSEAWSPWRQLPWNLDLGKGAPAVSGESSAQLTFAARPRGLTCLWLEVRDRPASGTLVPAMEQVLGCKLGVLVEGSTGRDWRLVAECGPDATRGQRKVEMRYRLEPLAAALRKQDVTLLLTNMGHSAVGQSLMEPPQHDRWLRDGYQYYQESYDLRDTLPSPTLKYGFTPLQVTHLIVFSVVFLAIIPLLALVRLRTALNPAVPADVRWTHFEIMESLTPFLIWFCWPVIVSSGDGFSILRLAAGGEDFLGALLAVLLASIPPFAVQVASAALVAPVYSQLRGFETTPGQLMSAAFWKNAAWLSPLMLTLLLSDPLHTLNTGTLIVLFAFFQLAGLVLHRQAFAATGAKGSRVTMGELKDRMMELAATAGAKVKCVYLIPDNPWKRVDAYSVGDGSIAVSSAVLQKLSRKEVDAMATEAMVWLRSTNDQKLMAGQTIGILAVFLIAHLVERRLTPAAIEISIGYASIMVYSALAAAAHRMQSRTDALTLKLTADWQSLIAGIVKLERMRMHVLGRALKMRLLGIARSTGMEGPNVTALIEQISEAPDHYPIPEVNTEKLAVIA